MHNQLTHEEISKLLVTIEAEKKNLLLKVEDLKRRNSALEDENAYLRRQLDQADKTINQLSYEFDVNYHF